MQEVSACAEIKVFAPVPALDYSRPVKEWIRKVPPVRQDQRLEVYHPRWLYPPLGGAWNPYLLYRQLLGPVGRLRSAFPFDLIDAHFAYPDGIAASMLADTFGVPFVVTLRGNETLHAQSGPKRERIGHALRKAARVISVSESLRQFALSLGVDPARARTIPNGIDTAVFFPRDRAECRRKHGIADGCKVVLSVGALIERKGHHRAVQALQELAAEGVKADLLIAGARGREGAFEEQIRSLVARLDMQDRVRFLGQVPPAILPELMSAADVLCLASDREGWPNAVNEAMGCGCPVVATDVGGLADLIPSADYGLVIPVGQPDKLRGALRQALAKLWDRSAIATWAGARSWKNVAAEVYEEFQGAIQMNADQRR
jgi:glycosyltransferase involved in cell wall biosynthesis